MLLALLACARVVSTYDVFNETVDEPDHIGAGMELLQFGTYTYERLHPPLARIAVALGPYLHGNRLEAQRDGNIVGDSWIVHDGSVMLHQKGDYWTVLALGRIGILPFLVLLFAVTFIWTRSLFGEWAGVFAVGLLSILPPILGHAGVATLDIPCAATVTLALFCFVRWLDSPSLTRLALVAITVALAFLTKFSSLGFLGASLAVGFAWKRPKIGWRHLATALLIGFFTLWAGCAFSVHPLKESWGPHPRIDGILREHPALQAPFELAMNTPLPLTELIIGARDLGRKNELGHESYLLGESRRTGWWSFFPIVLSVKTPLGFLALALSGLTVLLRGPNKLPALFALAILAVCLVSRIDLGARHILPIYPLLAMGAANILVNSSPRWLLIPSLLVAWTAMDSVRAQPDFLAHFNELAGNRPERILAESDLDWGQDLDRLARRLREQQIASISIRYFGSALLEKAGLPEYRELDPQKPTTGWIAISYHYLYLVNAMDGSYAWLRRYEPRQRVGKSIDLFYIPE